MTHDQRRQLAIDAMRAKRAELQHAPLDRVYGELFDAGHAAYLGDDVVVPTSPTQEMLEAVDFHVVGCCNMHDSDSIEVYSAMLAASPLADRGKR